MTSLVKTISNKVLADPKGDWQVEGIQWLLDNPFGILGDDMGLGKTYQALASFCIDPKETLILCPSYLQDNWKDEIDCFVPFKLHKYLKIQSYNTVQNLRLRKYTNFIMDEAHYLKSLEAKRTINTYNLLDECKVSSLRLLTGTPIKNRVPEWYSLLRLVHNFLPDSKFFDRYPNDWEFNCRFTRRTQRKIRVPGTKKFRMVNFFEGLQNKSELLTYIKPIMLRRLSKNILNLGEPNFMYNTFNAKGIYDGELKLAFENEARNSTVKRDSAIAKARMTSNYVKGLIEAGKKVVVFSDHPDAADEIYHNLKGNFGLISGSTPVSMRHRTVTDFQLGKLDGIIGTIGAMSTGYTMTKANDIIFNDISWVPEDNSQAIGRLNRIGQDKVVNVHLMVGSTMDKYIAGTVEKKSRVIQETT